MRPGDVVGHLPRGRWCAADFSSLDPKEPNISISPSRIAALLFASSLTLGTIGCTTVGTDQPDEDPSEVVEGAQPLSTACADASSDRFSSLLVQLDHALSLADSNRDGTRARNLRLRIALDTHPDGTGGTYGYANELYGSIAAARDDLAELQTDWFVTTNHQLTPGEAYSINWGLDTTVGYLSHAAISASVNLYQNDTANGATDARDAGDEVLAAITDVSDLRTDAYRCWADAYIP